MRNSTLLEHILSNPDKFFRISEFANAIGVTRQAVLMWVNEGKLPTFKKGNRNIVRGSWIREFIEGGYLSKQPRSIKELLTEYKLPYERK